MTSVAYTNEWGSLSGALDEGCEIGIYCLHGFSSLIKINTFLSYDHLSALRITFSAAEYLRSYTEPLGALSRPLCRNFSSRRLLQALLC